MPQTQPAIEVGEQFSGQCSWLEVIDRATKSLPSGRVFELRKAIPDLHRGYAMKGWITVENQQLIPFSEKGKYIEEMGYFLHGRLKV